MPWMQNEYGESYWVNDGEPPPPDLQPVNPSDVPSDYATPPPPNYGSGAASNPQQPGDYPAGPGAIPAPGAPGGPGPWTGGHDAPGGDTDYTDYGAGPGMGQPQGGGPPAPGQGGGHGPGNEPYEWYVGADGQARWVPSSQVAAIKAQQDKQESVLADQAARARDQQNTTNQQNQFRLDTEKAAQAANAAYQQSMVLYNNAQLAQQASRDAAQAEFQRQQLEFQQGQAAAQIGVQREQAQNQRRQQRPRRAAAVKFR